MTWRWPIRCALLATGLLLLAPSARAEPGLIPARELPVDLAVLLLHIACLLPPGLLSLLLFRRASPARRWVGRGVVTLLGGVGIAAAGWASGMFSIFILIVALVIGGPAG